MLQHFYWHTTKESLILSSSEGNVVAEERDKIYMHIGNSEKREININFKK